jgi:hypothetical protein
MLKDDIAKEISIIRGLIPWDKLPDKQTKACGCACKESCYRDANAILNRIQSHAKKEGWMKLCQCPDCSDIDCPKSWLDGQGARPLTEEDFK